mmetsp:Transcript_5429/g.13230  ORF Transcript_5429/g.13230 Transcript_5429/m.13230 type:complete len:223 (+) Transcript_5429:1121-1789(+)
MYRTGRSCTTGCCSTRPRLRNAWCALRSLWCRPLPRSRAPSFETKSSTSSTPSLSSSEHRPPPFWTKTWRTTRSTTSSWMALQRNRPPRPRLGSSTKTGAGSSTRAQTARWTRGPPVGRRQAAGAPLPARIPWSASSTSMRHSPPRPLARPPHRPRPRWSLTRSRRSTRRRSRASGGSSRRPSRGPSSSPGKRWRVPSEDGSRSTWPPTRCSAWRTGVPLQT